MAPASSASSDWLSDPLTTPSPSSSPSPPPTKAKAVAASAAASAKTIPSKTTDPIDSDSELSDLTEEEEEEEKDADEEPDDEDEDDTKDNEDEDEEDVNKAARQGKLEPNEDEEEEDEEDEEEEEEVVQPKTPAKRRRGGGMIPPPMWDWAYADKSPSKSRSASAQRQTNRAADSDSDDDGNDDNDEEEEEESEKGEDSKPAVAKSKLAGNDEDESDDGNDDDSMLDSPELKHSAPQPRFRKLQAVKKLNNLHPRELESEDDSPVKSRSASASRQISRGRDSDEDDEEEMDGEEGEDSKMKDVAKVLGNLDTVDHASSKAGRVISHKKTASVNTLDKLANSGTATAGPSKSLSSRVKGGNGDAIEDSDEEDEDDADIVAQDVEMTDGPQDPNSDNSDDEDEEVEKVVTTKRKTGTSTATTPLLQGDTSDADSAMSDDDNVFTSKLVLPDPRGLTAATLVRQGSPARLSVSLPRLKKYDAQDEQDEEGEEDDDEISSIDLHWATAVEPTRPHPKDTMATSENFEFLPRYLALARQRLLARKEAREAAAEAAEAADEDIPADNLESEPEWADELAIVRKLAEDELAVNALGSLAGDRKMANASAQEVAAIDEEDEADGSGTVTRKVSASKTSASKKSTNDEEEDQEVEVELAEGAGEDEQDEGEAEGEGDLEIHQPQRAEALDMLAALEIKFATLREQLYVDKMQAIADEEALVMAETHPEFAYYLRILEERKDRKIRLAKLRNEMDEKFSVTRRKEREDAVWSWWSMQKEDLRLEMIADANSKRRRLEREKRTLETRPYSSQRPEVDPHVPMPDPVPVSKLLAATSRQPISSYQFDPDHPIRLPSLPVLSDQEALSDLDMIWQGLGEVDAIRASVATANWAQAHQSHGPQHQQHHLARHMSPTGNNVYTNGVGHSQQYAAHHAGPQEHFATGNPQLMGVPPSDYSPQDSVAMQHSASQQYHQGASRHSQPYVPNSSSKGYAPDPYANQAGYPPNSHSMHADPELRVAYQDKSHPGPQTSSVLRKRSRSPPPPMLHADRPNGWEGGAPEHSGRKSKMQKLSNTQSVEVINSPNFGMGTDGWRPRAKSPREYSSSKNAAPHSEAYHQSQRQMKDLRTGNPSSAFGLDPRVPSDAAFDAQPQWNGSSSTSSRRRERERDRDRDRMQGEFVTSAHPQHETVSQRVDMDAHSSFSGSRALAPRPQTPVSGSSHKKKSHGVVHQTPHSPSHSARVSPSVPRSHGAPPRMLSPLPSPSALIHPQPTHPSHASQAGGRRDESPLPPFPLPPLAASGQHFGSGFGMGPYSGSSAAGQRSSTVPPAGYGANDHTGTAGTVGSIQRPSTTVDV